MEKIASEMFKSLIKYKGTNSLTQEEYDLLEKIDRLEIEFRLIKCYLKVNGKDNHLKIEINKDADFNQYCLNDVKNILEDK